MSTITKKPRVSKDEYAQQQRDMQRELLEAAVEKLTTSEGWMNYLNTRAKFHKYSFMNTILIALQCPEATRVAGKGGKDGKTGWKSMNRTIKADQWDKPIYILAPCLVPLKDESGQPIMDEKGKPKQRVAFFRSVKVYDISQTEGEDLPDVPAEPVEGDSHEEFLYRAEQYAEFLGYTFRYETMPMNKGGHCDKLAQEIVLNDARPVNSQVRTAIHELAHAMGIDYTDYTRSESEVIVESVAYLVTASVGLDTAGMSVPYIAKWGNDDDDPKAVLKIMREFATTIDEAAKTLEEALS